MTQGICWEICENGEWEANEGFFAHPSILMWKLQVCQCDILFRNFEMIPIELLFLGNIALAGENITF